MLRWLLAVHEPHYYSEQWLLLLLQNGSFEAPGHWQARWTHLLIFSLPVILLHVLCCHLMSLWHYAIIEFPCYVTDNSVRHLIEVGRRKSINTILCLYKCKNNQFYHFFLQSVRKKNQDFLLWAYFLPCKENILNWIFPFCPFLDIGDIAAGRMMRKIYQKLVLFNRLNSNFFLK